MIIKHITFVLLCMSILNNNNMLGMKRHHSDKKTTPYHVYPDYKAANDIEEYEEKYHYALYLNTTSMFIDYMPHEYREKYVRHMLKDLEENKREIALRQQK